MAKNINESVYAIGNKGKIQPSFTAIEWENGSLSYSQFVELAKNIGSALKGKFKLEKGDKGLRWKTPISSFRYYSEYGRLVWLPFQ